MSVFKCKMCGGTIEFNPGDTVGVCDSCGTKQTLPKLDDDRRANLYDRANHFRRNNEFDKAMGIYESILNEDTTDAEAYWSLVLCRYGIEYVEDPATHNRVPTVNRAQYTSIFADEDYKSALANADTLQKTIYEEEAKAIDEIQKGILEISQKEEPFDVFICYKETGADGRRTVDSVRATELYHELVKEGFKVFFSRITLEDKLGTAYEPYIFAALNSAKVMVVLGTKARHFNAVWVKNEWSRYLSLIKSGAKKTLIPAYQDMDPYDLPEEFSHLQAQDMSKLGFMQDLIRGIKKITAVDEPKQVVKETVVVNNTVAASASVAPLLERVFMFLEDGKWNDANIYCEKVLDSDPKNAEAYLGKLMAELQVKTRKQLADCAQPFDRSDNFAKVIRFGDEALENEMRGYIAHINDRNENTRKQGVYNDALIQMRSAKTESDFRKAAESFNSIKGFKDANEKVSLCLKKREEARKNAIYDDAKLKISNDSKESNAEAIKLFKSIIDWKDSRTKIDECTSKIRDIEIAEEKAEEERKRIAAAARIAAEKARARNKKIAMICGPIVAALIVFLIVLNTVIFPAGNYKKALAAADSGNYSEAYSLFGKYANYKDTQDQIGLTKVKEAADLLDAEKYDEAYAILKETGDTETVNKNVYNRALKFMESNEEENALALFSTISGYKDTDKQIKKIGKSLYGDIFKNIKVGSLVKFGNYYQSNSENKEEIEWRVLEVKDGKALIISEKALDCQEYNTEYTSVTWETCSLRKWLNETFINEAFNKGEQTILAETKVTADANPSYSTSPGNETKDKVFLLSINEAKKYFSSDDDRMCVPTAYAIKQGAYTSSSYTKGGKATCWWWLRSPGYDTNYAARVNYDGDIYNLGYRVYTSYDCVRPVLWIEI
ncbi:MAG: DUF6273 domain-containing protein [Clostridiales bacterium]|nr:DUF6273 domain-containing protein [Clostridiales bacterium]